MKYFYLFKKWPKAEMIATNLSRNSFQHRMATNNPMSEVDSPVESIKEAQELLDRAALFRGSDRIKLIHSIINSTSIGCCGLNTSKLLKDKCLLVYSALPDELESRMVRPSPRFASSVGFYLIIHIHCS